jgi:hypothetical protein
MPIMGEQQLAVLAAGLRDPSAAIAKVLIAPLLEAMRKRPSGVAAREMPWQESRVSPLANGEPATAVKAPEAALIFIAVIVWSPLLET